MVANKSTPNGFETVGHMSWITVIWSAGSGACLMLGLMYLLVWSRDRRSWASLSFVAMVIGVLGLTMTEMVTMRTESPEVFGLTIRWAHLVYAIGVTGSLGFVHFYFGTGRKWLFALAIGLRLLAVLANFTTGLNLHITAIHSLATVTFLGEQVSIPRRLGSESVGSRGVARFVCTACFCSGCFGEVVALRLAGVAKNERGSSAAPWVGFILFTVVNAGLVSVGGAAIALSHEFSLSGHAAGHGL